MDAVLVTLNANVPVCVIAPPPLLTCVQTSVTLDGGNSSQGPNFTYEWTDVNGIVVGTGLTLIVSQPGIYTLKITDIVNGCFATVSVLIEEDVEAPTCSINVTNELSCFNPTATLDASGSTTGSNIAYVWTTLDGNIVSGSTSLNPVVDLSLIHI